MNKKAKISNLVGWIVFALALTLLVLLIINNMNFTATVQQILGFFGNKPQ